MLFTCLSLASVSLLLSLIAHLLLGVPHLGWSTRSTYLDFVICANVRNLEFFRLIAWIVAIASSGIVILVLLIGGDINAH